MHKPSSYPLALGPAMPRLTGTVSADDRIKVMTAKWLAATYNINCRDAQLQDMKTPPRDVSESEVEEMGM